MANQRARRTVKVGWLAALLALGLSGNVADAQDDFEQEEWEGEQVLGEENDSPLEQNAIDGAALQRLQEADQNFEAVMQGQSLPAPAQSRRVSSFEELSARLQHSAGVAPQVEVELGEFGRVRDQLNALRKENERYLGPAVVLGGADYRGRAHEGALELTLTLQVTLGHPDRWKVVPLAGEDVVLARARVGGEDLPVSRQSGYHVWVTKRTGELSVQVDLLVPARGPRGSIEFDFVVPRTPVTRFACRFPLPGLEPRLEAAVQSTVRTVGQSTELEATLAPTTRIHLVGFRDLRVGESRAAKVFAESTNLLSVGEVASELFAVIRYTILYGATKSFELQLPAGMTVVWADGKGAFRHELEEGPAGPVLRGETAFPIRDSFEISLRLRRELGEGASELEVPIVRCLNVERQHGFVGVEVTGKLQLEERARERALAIDVRQLPGEMLESAVSPILKAYRYHDPTALVRLAALRLPEKEPVSASVDRVRAFSVVSADGQLLTDLRVTLRNRLRHSITLRLPPNAEVRSTLLDGEPVKPSRNAEGGLMLPLKRSAGDGQLEPFTVQVVLAGSVGGLGWLGRKQLALPAFDLPVSSLQWSIYVPAKNLYSAPEGEIEPQRLVGTATWHQPRQRPAGALRNEDGGGAMAESADAGAMSVRIKLPENGVRLEHERYWLESGEPLAVSIWYVRGWLRLPGGLVAWAAVLLGLAAIAWAGATPRRKERWLGAAVALVALYPAYRLAGVGALILAFAGGALVYAWRRGALLPLPERVRAWLAALPERFAARTRLRWSVPLALWRLALAGSVLLLTLFLVGGAARFVWLLFSPLPG